VKNARGFTLIELLIVVAIIAIIAAIAIPSLIRSRLSANESATIGDVRTVLSAQAAYHAVNQGFYDGSLTCLSSPQGCLPSYPANGPAFLDQQLASLAAKSGYNRAFAGGTPPAPNATLSATSVTAYKYDATPSNQNRSGIRGFAGDHSGRICVTPDGSPVPAGPGGGMTRNCETLR
jgi:prepilin-type N-terminal cleavage/methylation domain-containing protein